MNPLAPQPYPKGAFGPGPVRPIGRGCLWGLAYGLAGAGGASLLPLAAVYAIWGDADQGSPLGIVFVLAVLSIVGALGGLAAVGLIHFISVAVRLVLRP